jgi:hypothetical protein
MQKEKGVFRSFLVKASFQNPESRGQTDMGGKIKYV